MTQPAVVTETIAEIIEVLERRNQEQGNIDIDAVLNSLENCAQEASDIYEDMKYLRAKDAKQLQQNITNSASHIGRLLVEKYNLPSLGRRWYSIFRNYPSNIPSKRQTFVGSAPIKFKSPREDYEERMFADLPKVNTLAQPYFLPWEVSEDCEMPNDSDTRIQDCHGLENNSLD